MTSPITHYQSSNGRKIALADMVSEHLANAVAKLERDRPHVLAALKAEQSRRER